MNKRTIRAFPPATRDWVRHPSQLHRYGWDRMLSRGRALFASILLAAAMLSPAPALAQGCAQCRDNTAATSPATQRAYRHAIILMVAAGGGIFLAALVLLKRHSPGK